MAEKPKRVTQRIVRGEDGRVKILYIDLDTLQYVDDPFSQGYKVVTANTPIENVINVDEEDPQPNPENPVVTDPAEEAAIKESVQSAEGMRGSNSPTYSSPSTNQSVNTNTNTRSGIRTPGANAQSTTSGYISSSNSQQSLQGTQVANAAGTARGANPSSEISNRSSISYGMGSGRPNAPSQNIQNSIASSVGNVFGPQANVTITSGQQTPAQLAQIERGRAAIDKARSGGTLTAQEKKDADFASSNVNKNDRHPTGQAADFRTSTNDPNKSLSPVAMNDLAMDFAKNNPNAGVGYSMSPKGTPGYYMGPDVMHLDTSGLAGSWGANQPKFDDGQGKFTSMRENIDFARDMAGTDWSVPPTFDAPTPFGSDDPQSAPTATGAPREGLQGLAASAIDSMGNQRAGTAANTSLDAASGTDMTANPGALASLGYTPRTEQDMADIGFALAGELGPYGLKTLGDENSLSKKELANMIATIENRAAATGKSIKDVLSPSQYNSLMEKNLGVTRANFTKYGDDIMAAVKDFYSPASFNNPANATHYANLSISNPGWAAGLLGDQKVGSHTFGRLSDEYSPSSAYSDVRTNSGLASYARDQINNQTSKGGYQPSLDRFSDMTDAVSRSNGESQGGRGRGGYSASSAEGSRSGSGSSGVSSRSEGGGLRSDSGGFSSGSSGYGPDMGRFDGVQGAVEASNSSGKSGSSDKGTSSYGGAKSSGDAQSSGKSGGKSSGGGFSSGRTSGKTDDN